MLTDQDIAKLTKVFATREEVVLKGDLSRVSADVVVVKSDVAEIKEKIGALEESINALTNSIDGLIGELKKLREEYAAMSVKLDRHETWIKQLAEKLGVSLEY